jgi:hypothetical protein
MIHWLYNKKSYNPNECIEEVFFRTILIISVIGCFIALFLDFLLTNGFSYVLWLNLLLTQVIILMLYSIKKILFQYVAVAGLFAIDVIITYRGVMYPEFHHITYTLLITVGFVCSLITKGTSRKFLKLLVLLSLLLALFKGNPDGQFLFAVRQAVPYIIIYFIVTIASGILKDRYERNQGRLTELVELLNQKNSKINEQHTRLLKSYDQLSELNGRLERKVKNRTFQLEEVAFANSHAVRGSLARILGLLHLIHLDPLGKDHYLKMIYVEAEAMDDVIHIVGRAIERNIAEK